MSEEKKQDLRDWIEIINTSTYSLNAIKKVCYKFSSAFSVKLEKTDKEHVKVIFKFNEPITEAQLDLLKQRFHQELLDQDLREIVFKETEGVRNLILAHAFSKTTLIEPESSHD
ncbi:His-Xaa-Ser system protein HxsD [Legionella septentrionalis]|uniref:His-Xaa-Ser system protein HxsD n=1 Tax=Legionella septentrionalis TaxID=2498109 RepID=UPI000F8EA1E6|nr:His-Xaa-Ser system protein HxsD [Legionella septentrionalis]RUR08557.1 His-Xaa-Ser system protein HxsD [Legionella septentrionalis]